MHRPMLRALKLETPNLESRHVTSDASPDVEGIETHRPSSSHGPQKCQMHRPMLRALKHNRLNLGLRTQGGQMHRPKLRALKLPQRRRW
jgi:hypothetical protein